MFKKLVIAIVLIGLAAGLAAAQTAPKPRVSAFMPLYWVLGGAKSADPNIPVDGRLVLIYTESSPNVVGTVYGFAAVAEGKFAGDPFLVNVVQAGQTYKVAMPQGSDGYGANALDVIVTGKGFDQLSGDLLLAYGAGPVWSGGELAPLVRIWFGNRLYQPTVYSKSNPFVITPTPNVQAKISIAAPFALASDINAYSIIVDPGAAQKVLNITGANMVAKAMEAGMISSFSLEYDLKEAEKLAEGEHTFQVTAKSAGTLGAPATTVALATVEVMGGPLRLIGTPITYPSPYSISKHKIVTIQYGLSSDANIEIYVTGVSGQRVKRWTLNAGQEGGSAGINKVTWDGKSDQGYLVGNAIYVGTIVSRDDNRLLGKFKLTVVD